MKFRQKWPTNTNEYFVGTAYNNSETARTKEDCAMHIKRFLQTTLLILAVGIATAYDSLSGNGDEAETIELGNEQLGEFAPPDAFEEGSAHPYYGSENEWNRRFFYEHNKEYYKRRGQRQMLDLVEGRPQETEQYCRELLAHDPEDLESLFNLAVALAHQDELHKAMEIVRTALERGLPMERFLAGPRDILKPLTDSAPFKKLAETYEIHLLHGPMIGRVTSHSAGFWVRTLNESPVQVIASENRNLANPTKTSIGFTRATDDYTTTLELSGLEPDVTYFYDVYVDGRSMFNRDPPAFRTFPEANSGAKYSVAFGGGAGYVPEHEKIWDVVRGRHPLAFLAMGDNVYMNMPEQPSGFHEYTYYRRQSRPEFRRLSASCSIYAIWDDHDAATDDCWLGPYKDKPTWKMALLDFFKLNWINPSYGSPEWPACYFSFSIADVDFFMLDGRFYRTNPFADDPTMLGPVQKQWLLNGLKKSTALFKVIASPVPWTFATKGKALDTWSGFRDERNEIFDFLAEHRIGGVVLISADRHRSDAWKIDRDNGYPLYEFESSRLTNQHSHPLIPEALFGYNEKNSFGLLDFDLGKSDPTINYQIVNIDNQVVYSLVICRSALSHVEKKLSQNLK
jgi:alkaline phosphatase D